MRRLKSAMKWSVSRGNVGQALAQRRNLDQIDLKAVVEVFAQMALADRDLRVAIAAGDDADVERHFAGRSDRPYRAFLEGPQKLALGSRVRLL
jgi:hypothetical protein